MRLQTGFNFFEEGLSGDTTNSHNVVVEQSVVLRRENT